MSEGSAGLVRIRRQFDWMRSQGIRRVTEEKHLQPLETAAQIRDRWSYRRDHGQPGQAGAIWLLGLQRSGTNMVVAGFRNHPAVEIRSENNRAAFVDYRLRDLAAVARLVDNSRHSHVLLKPLSDAHRAIDLLQLDAGGRPGRAVWMVRSVEGRVRSALARFGDAANLALHQIADGGSPWQGEGISASSRRHIGDQVRRGLDDATAQALLWYVRNQIFFELGLDRRDDTILIRYEDLLADPAVTMRRICEHVELDFRPRLVGHIERRPPATQKPLDIDPVVAELCADLTARLDAVR